jgi:DNA-binding transcriptional regulator WhiA
MGALLLFSVVLPNELRPADNCQVKLEYQEASLNQINEKSLRDIGQLCFKLGKADFDEIADQFSDEDKELYIAYCMEGLNGN